MVIMAALGTGEDAILFVNECEWGNICDCTFKCGPVVAMFGC